ncbi:MAG TPA: hypothetical protein VGV88_08390 [Candidatus Dormibacteraeota bacterium]|nr:hypothetical protein [Candidatus Dormibacteraeota bacterium]
MGFLGNLPQAMTQLASSIEQLIRILWPFTHPLQPLAVVLKDGIDLLLALWFKFVLSTTDFETGHDFVGSAAIKSFEPTVQLVADSLLVLVVVWASYRIMWGHGVRSQYTARVLLPRVFLAGVLINFSQPMFQAAVTASNTLCSVITHFQTIPDWSSWWHTFTVNPQDSVFEVVSTAGLVLGYDVLAVAYIVRYTVLIVLAISAPFAGLLLVLPETAHLAKMWRKLFVTNLLMQPAQLFVIAIGFGLENSGFNPLRHAFALAALLVVFKVPGAMGSAENVAHKLESLLHHSVSQVEHAVLRAA